MNENDGKESTWLVLLVDGSDHRYLLRAYNEACNQGAAGILVY